MADKFSSELAAVLAIEIVGNHASDSELIFRLSEFIYNSDNHEEQVIAMCYMSETVMGFPSVEITSKMIADANSMFAEFYNKE